MRDKKAFSDLKKDVINIDICTFCGGCIASCPFEVIGYKGETPILIGPCLLCQTCWYSCPRTIYNYDEIENRIFGRRRNEDEYIGIYKSIYSARTLNKEILKHAQDGGVVTTLLIYALEKGIIDSAIVSKLKEESWRPWPIVALKKEEVIQGAGTKYMASPVLIGVSDAIENYTKGKLGVVGTPCEVQAMRKMQYVRKASFKLGSKIQLIIGLFCMESFRQKDLTEFMTSKGIEPLKVKKCAITKGKFITYGGGKEEEESLNVPIKDMKECARGSCHFCTDFTCEHADISVGSVGSPDGWSTVIIRTEIGEKIFKEVCNENYIEFKPIEEVKPGLTIVNKLSKNKRDEAKKLELQSIKTK